MQLSRIGNGDVWQGKLQRRGLRDGAYSLSVAVEDTNGQAAEDRIRMVLGGSAYKAPKRSARDQGNAVEAWPKRGLLGTRLGPNQNGRQW